MDKLSALNYLTLHFALLLLLMLNYSKTVAYQNDSHNVAKRLDVDTCAGKYDQVSDKLLN